MYALIDSCPFQVVRLGGHSVPRTRFNKGGPNIGLGLINAARAALKGVQGVDLITGAQVGGREGIGGEVCVGEGEGRACVGGKGASKGALS
jgi:hypothetical protein